MTDPGDLVSTTLRITQILDALGIRYHLTGGLSVILYSEPRSTLDIDVVLDPAAAAVHRTELLKKCSADFSLNPDAFDEALSRRGVFQLLDLRSGFKVDLYLREAVPGELTRSTVINLKPDCPIRVVALSDAILSKLLWIRKGSHRSRRDVRWLLSVLPESELSALRQFASDLGLLDLLNEVRLEREPDE